MIKKTHKIAVLCKVLCTVVCTCLVCFGCVLPNTIENSAKAVELENGSIDCGCSGQAGCVMDVDTHRIFYAKNKDAKLPMASTTKVVTAITAIENFDDLDTRMKIDDRAVGIEGSSIYLKKGEELSLRELLYGLMLRSGNDSAIAIAYMVAGGVEQFAEMMNNLAQKVGATNSHFTNPHGLDDPNHYTTAYDLALLSSYALNKKDFAEIVKTKTIKICEGEENYRYLVNKNKLLYNMPDCIGVKTGYTKKSGRCLVSASERDNLRVVSVVLNCGPMFEESKDMLNAVQDKYKSVEIVEPYHYYKSVPVNNGEQKTVELYSREGLRLPLSEKERANISVEYNLPESLDAPVEGEKIVGDIKVYYGKRLIFSQNVYTMDNVDSKLLKDKVKDILDEWSI